MAAAVILTSSVRSNAILPRTKSNVENLISEIPPFFQEVILICHEPALFLPLIKDRARILTPYYKNKEKGHLSSLHTSLALAMSDEVWLLHEHYAFPGMQTFKQLKSIKSRTNSHAILFARNKENLLVFSLFDKRVLKTLERLLKNDKIETKDFLNQIHCIQAP
jgi:hypothetical protein